MEPEIWKVVEGWPHYEVSSFGNLRKVDGSPVGQWESDQGYMRARLSRPRRMVRVHILVARAFCPNPEQKPGVNHIDCDRSHNHFANLEWSTQAENLAHSRKLGRIQCWTKGRRSATAKFSEEQAQSIRAERANGATLRAIADKYGANKSTIGKIISGRSYRPPAPEAT